MQSNYNLKIFYVLLCFLYIGSSAVLGQDNRPKTVANTLIVKLLPETIKIIRASKSNTNPLLKAFGDVDIVSFTQMFPNATANNCLPKNIGNPNNVDLSRIYEITYGGNVEQSIIIRNLRKSGLVEYVEPKYIDYTLSIPNDPEAQPTSGKQWYLSVVKSYDAWGIEKGDTNVIIAIVDTDQNILHPDLKDNVKINYKDPINGVDDDKDGYIDNYKGWDVADNDRDVTAKQHIIVNSDPTKNDTVNGRNHGTMVFGFAGATTNNGIGVAGSGYNCKILPIKAMRDSDARTGGIINGYQGIIYAAERGAKIINCSWGSFDSYTRTAQDIVNYATFNFDALVISAAGNENADKKLFPGSYDNVLCVAASFIDNNKNDIKAGFATYNHRVDISSPGDSTYSTYQNDYLLSNGSSYSAPTVAGAAGLIRSKFPKLTALQTLHQLRTTADDMYQLPANKQYYEKLGKGRLNMYRALTETTSPAVRLSKSNMPSAFANVTYTAKNISLVATFTNYLAATNNLQITVRSLSPYIEMIDSTFNAGKINTLDTINNAQKPFKFYVKPNIPANYTAEFRLQFSDGSYSDYQYINGYFNPDFIDLDTNDIRLTIAKNGKIGYRNNESTEGNSLIYKTKSLLFESGLIVTSNQNKISDCVRSAPQGKTSESFESTVAPSYVNDNFQGQQIKNSFIDTTRNKVNIEITQNSFASPNTPNRNFAIISYIITNKSAATIDSLKVGIYADWDIMNANRNKADFDAENRLAYTYSTANGGLFAGVSLLSNLSVSVFSHDHETVPGNINPNDGFTDTEKNFALSNGLYKTKAGGTGSGKDVSQTIGGVLLNVKPNEKRQIGFAFIAGDNKASIVKSALDAKNLFVKSIEPNNVSSALESIDFNMYPNPANDRLTIQVSNLDHQLVHVMVSDVVGKQVYATAFYSNLLELNVKELPQGMYQIQFISGNQISYKKFIKQ